MTPIRWTCAMAAVAALAAPAAGQIDGLETVDQMIEDCGSLSVSLRHIEPGLRQPNNFAQVFRVPGDSGEFMRIQGALYAVFRLSEYAVDKDEGVFPLVPSGTVFHIGPPPMLAHEAPHEIPINPDRIEARIDLRLDHERLYEAEIAGGEQFVINRPAGVRIASDPSYRTARIQALLKEAAEHQAARGPSTPSSK